MHDAASTAFPLAIKLHILVGTMTGTAELVAQELELALGDEDVAIDVTLMDRLDHRAFAQPGIYLICTSTYGQGDVPDNAKALYADLLASRPDLSHLRYRAQRLGASTGASTGASLIALQSHHRRLVRRIVRPDGQHHSGG